MTKMTCDLSMGVNPVFDVSTNERFHTFEPGQRFRCRGDIRDKLLTFCDGDERLFPDPSVRPTVIGQAGSLKPRGHSPAAHLSADSGQAQVCMCVDGNMTPSDIDCIVLVPFTDDVRMRPGESGRLARSIWFGAENIHALDLEIAMDPMMPIAPARIVKQTEEEEYVANADTLIAKMRLSGTGLAEGAAPGLKHWVMMAQAQSAQTTFCYLLDDIAKFEIAIGRRGASLSGDRQTDWPARYDRRRNPAGPTVKSLAAEYNFHWECLPVTCSFVAVSWNC